MKKKTRRQITKLESNDQRRLELSRETVRVLGADVLSHAIGGSGCSSTSWTTEKITSDL
jgi:hypothetical protein